MNLLALSSASAGCASAESEPAPFCSRLALPLFNHEANTIYSEHIANLVWVGNRSYRTMTDSGLGKFLRQDHATLNMHMTIDKTRHDVRIVLILRKSTFPDIAYNAFLYRYLTVIYPLLNHIDDMASIGRLSDVIVHCHCLSFPMV